MQKILYTSAQVRQEITRLFSASKKQRVAIVAFVGAGAEKYLPRPRGLHLICWAKAGGTNPDALRKLKQLGVKIEFAENLHMKVYWTQDQGAVVTSANLSTNALGAGGLKEIGVFLEPGEFDIDRAIRAAKPSPWSDKIIRDLDRQHNELATKSPRIFQPRKPSPDFLEWLNSPARAAWKLALYEWSNDPVSLDAKRLSKEIGEPEPAFHFRAKPRQYLEGDWVLTFQLKGHTPIQIEWMNADRVLRVPKTDKAYDTDPDRPFEVIQLRSLKYYSGKPFPSTTRFCEAFKKALRQTSPSRIDEWTEPSRRLLAQIRKYY